MLGYVNSASGGSLSFNIYEMSDLDGESFQISTANKTEAKYCIARQTNWKFVKRSVEYNGNVLSFNTFFNKVVLLKLLFFFFNFVLCLKLSDYGVCWENLLKWCTVESLNRL